MSKSRARNKLDDKEKGQLSMSNQLITSILQTIDSF